MTTATIRQKLYEYIRGADERKVKAIYTIIENDLLDNNEWWKDVDFISTLDSISSDLKNGTDKGYEWDKLKYKKK